MTQAPQGRLRKGSKNSNSSELSQAKKEILKASGEMKTRKRSHNVVGTPERTCRTGVSQVTERLWCETGCEGPCLGLGLLRVLHKAPVPHKIEHLSLMVNQLSTLLIQNLFPGRDFLDGKEGALISIRHSLLISLQTRAVHEQASQLWVILSRGDLVLTSSSHIPPPRGEESQRPGTQPPFWTMLWMPGFWNPLAKQNPGLLLGRGHTVHGALPSEDE